MSSVRRSLAYTAADSYLSLPLQLASTMVISRLLTPKETGIFAVAAVFAAIASTLRDFGVAEYLIQEKELRDEHVRASLTANLAMSWAMGLLLFFGAPAAADFYRSPGVAEVMRILAFNFLLIPFGAVNMAFYRRQLDFRPIFIASILSNIVGFVVAIACALGGLSYLSLAWSSLASTVVTVATSVWFRPAGLPYWPGITGLAKVISFGKHASGIYIFGQAGKSAPEIIIGRALDMPSVAFFSRANGLIELFHKTVLRAVMPVCMPYFAKNNREQGGIAVGYLTAVSFLTAVGWPFFVFLGIVAYGAIRLIYGDQWTSSVPLAQILCAAALLEIVHVLATEAIIAVGRVDRSNALQFGIQSSRVIGLLAVIPFGLEGGCWGLFGAAMFGLVYAQWMLGRTSGVRVGDVVAACRPSAYITAVSTLPVAAWATLEQVSESNFPYFLSVGGMLTATLWLISVRLFLPSLWAEITAVAGRITSWRQQRP